MNKWKECMAAGFLFDNKEEAECAREELEKINQLEEKLNYDNLDAVAMVYIKGIKNQLFHSVVGYSFLKRLQTILEDNHYNKIAFDKYPIPVEKLVAANNDGLTDGTSDAVSDAFSDNALGSHQTAGPKLKVRINHQTQLKQKLKMSIWINIILVLVVIALFGIAFTSDSPNIINYKQNILNEYSQWEQDLSERESIIREKERELQLSE